MTVCTFTEEEAEAAREYGAEAKYFHALHQGRGHEFEDDPDFDTFWQKVGARTKALDLAIAKCPLLKPTTLYSGHSFGLFVRGALRGEPEQFVGLRYQYAGFISTSSVPAGIEKFIDKGAPETSPTALVLELPAGFHALDMNAMNMQGEFEFLLPRNRSFDIVAAARLPTYTGELLQFTMRPTTGAN